MKSLFVSVGSAKMRMTICKIILKSSCRREDAERVQKYSNVLTMLSPFGLFCEVLSDIWG